MGRFADPDADSDDLDKDSDHHDHHIGKYVDLDSSFTDECESHCDHDNDFDEHDQAQLGGFTDGETQRVRTSRATL